MAKKTMFERLAQEARRTGDASELPSWFNEDLHRVEPRGIVLAATGDLLAEDGLPVNAAARAALAALAEPAAPVAAADETLPGEAPAIEKE